MKKREKNSFELVNEIEITGKERAENVEEAVDEIEITGKEKEPLNADIAAFLKTYYFSLIFSKKYS